MKATLINQSQLLNLIAAIPAGQICSFVTRKECDMKKRGNPYLTDYVVEVGQVTVMVNFDYSNAVNNRREKAGLPRDFTPKQRAWGTHLKVEGYPKAKIVTHKDSLYADTQVLTRTKKRYFINGKEVAKDILKPHLKASSPSPFEHLTASQVSEMSHEDIEKWACENVSFRDFKFANIARIVTGGKTYVIVENQAQAAAEIETEIADGLALEIA